MLRFDNILEIGRRFSIQWEKTMGCEHCRTDRQSLIILPMAAERVLAFYEAACLTYGITQLDSEMSSHQEGPPTSSPVSFHARRPGLDCVPQQVMCLKSNMKLGRMDLEGSNAKSLVRSLLSRRLLKLCTLLEDLKDTIGDLWHMDWAQQTNILKTCERSTACIIDKLVILIGEIR